MVTCMSTPQNGAASATDAEIGNRIANALIIKGINQKALSDATGISYPTLRRSLTGGRSLTFLEFAKIASAIDVKPSALLPAALTESAA
jgi:transcriptional regulator with XRE-family HTH domain